MLLSLHWGNVWNTACIWGLSLTNCNGCFHGECGFTNFDGSTEGQPTFSSSAYIFLWIFMCFFQCSPLILWVRRLVFWRAATAHVQEQICGNAEGRFSWMSCHLSYVMVPCWHIYWSFGWTCTAIWNKKWCAMKTLKQFNSPSSCGTLQTIRVMFVPATRQHHRVVLVRPAEKALAPPGVRLRSRCHGRVTSRHCHLRLGSYMFLPGWK